MTIAQVPYGDLGRTGEFRATGVPRLNGVRWRFGIEQAFEAAERPDVIEGKSAEDWLRTVPVVTNGLVVLGDSNRGVVHALDAASGRLRWRNRPITPLVEEMAAEEGIAPEDLELEPWNCDVEYGVLGPASVADGVAYLAVNEWAFGFDVATGRQLWRRRDSGHSGADFCPVVVGDSVLTQNLEGVQAYDLRTGELRWHNDDSGGFLLAPAAVDDDLVFFCEGRESHRTHGGVHALEARTGRTVWSVESDACVVDDRPEGRWFEPLHAVAWGGRVWATTWSDAAEAIEIVGLDRHTGAESWTYRCPHADRMSYGAVAISSEGVLVFHTESEGLQAVRIADRELLWQRRVTGELGASPAIAAGVVYQATDDGVLHALRLEDGVPLWSFDTGEPTNAASYEDDWYFDRDLPVAIGDDTIYLRTATGLYALG